MRVVMSAYACDPGGTSERRLGWDWVAAAAAGHDVTVVTRRKFEAPVRQALRSQPHLRLTPVFVDPPLWLTRWKRGEHGLYFFYVLWQVFAWRTISQLHGREPFDVGHHITFALDWLPAGIAYVPRLPVVWGPFGPGVVLSPPSLVRWLGPRWLAAEVGRAIVTSGMRSVFGRANARRSAVVVANNREAARYYAWHRRVELEQHAVIDPPGFSDAGEIFSSHDIVQGRRAISVARLLRWKGIDMAIAAIAQSPGWSLIVYGAGPAEERLRKRVCLQGLEDRVFFRGAVGRDEILQAMTTSDVMLFPSTRDSAPGAVAEAISLGLPVVCLDIGGPGAMVRDGEGIRVPANGHAVSGVVGALRDLPARHAGAPRWNSARLGGLLDDWYTAAQGDGQVGRAAEHSAT